MIKMEKKKSFYNCIDHDKYITNAIRNRNINAVESDTFIYFSYRFQVKTYKKLIQKIKVLRGGGIRGGA